MFPPVTAAAGGQSPDGMFLDPAEQARAQLNTSASGQGGSSGQQNADPNEPVLKPGQTEKDLYEARKAHWQSKVDKATHEAKQLREAYEAERDAIAVGRLAMKNPTVLQGLLAGSQPPAEPEEKTPVQPERPDSFNEAEAYSNPESESWKYRKKLEQYTNEKLAYLERRDAKREDHMRKLQEEQRGAQEAQQRNAQLATVLASQYGFRQNELGGFFQMIEEDPTLDDLVTVFRMRQRRAMAGQSPQGQVQPNQGSRALPPPVLRQGAGQPNHTVENAVSANLIKATSGR